MKQALKSSSALLMARDILAQNTPLNRDCGQLCGHACCQGPGGMVLYPGEAALYARLPKGFQITRDDGFLPAARLLTCQGFCDRDTRPLACRIFPLQFIITQDGSGDVRLDPRAWQMCPLMSSGIEGLAPTFVAAAREGAAILANDPQQKAFLLAQQQATDQLTNMPWDREVV